MRLLLDIADRLFSWTLLAVSVFAIWIAALLIREQNMNAPEDEVDEQWRTIMKRVRSEWRNRSKFR